jgi:hypothetical protein
MMIDPQWLRVAATASITTAIGAVIGFVSAIMAEVWKSNRTEQKQSERLERAIYAEMTDLYSKLRNLLKDHKEAKGTELDIPDAVTASLIRSYSVIDSYKYAKQNPHQFYSLKHAFTINGIYSSLRDIR